jgi:3-phytase
MKRSILFFVLLTAACAPIRADLASVAPVAETKPVASRDDAADDPAIWINPSEPAESRILGTDKQAGLYVYDLKGAERQFVAAGALNNVDLRQNVTIGAWSGDIAAASNRSNDTITLFTINGGNVEQSGSLPSIVAEPYGLCMGVREGAIFVFVAHKTGDFLAYRLDGPDTGSLSGRIKLQSQLEGCVFDDDAATIYIGEEERGIWKTSYSDNAFSDPVLIDEVDGESGVSADVEGLALYKPKKGVGYLIASSQGNDSFAVYSLETERFLGRFAIADGDDIDGAEETDGVEASAVALGAGFPRGVLIVQDGFNRPRGERQNFKIVDWRDVEAALQLSP